jgi:hypothetical protein
VVQDAHKAVQQREKVEHETQSMPDSDIDIDLRRLGIVREDKDR